MNENFTLAGKGLKYLFLAQILALVAIVAMIVPVLGWIVGVVLALASLVLSIYGPYVARDVHDNFRIALWAAIAALVVSIVSSLVPEEAEFISGLLNIAKTVLGFAMVYFVCTASEVLLDAKGDGELAQRVSTIWKLYAGCALVSIVCALVGWIPVLNILAAIASVVTTIVQLVAYVLLLIFYYKASKSLLGE